MGLNLEGKKGVVDEVSSRLATAQTLVLAEYKGLPVAQMTRLRAAARASEVYLHVQKNTLVRRAVQGSVFASLAEQMKGPLIYAISEDPVAAAKVLNEFAKTNDKLVVKAGSFSGELLDKAGVQALASIPGRKELLAQLLGVMQAPLTGFACALSALARQREEAVSQEAVS
ncbi:50S ribosomal protein L10 [Accumulibacter sp.]|uniref:50S ribosomal protein L10 n=1 Tax=Accumulibacter sp. TaxID=2053492 RepID=UPI0025DEC960|nr:50S ribosomal protein L10 [Accumulibacter sp.]MCM8627632.1 50S ribosomal protein L10 [Accumulibacter sp.]